MARSLPVTLLMKSKIVSSSPRWTFPLDFDCAFLVRRNIAICATIWSTFRPHQVKTLCTTCWNRLLTKSQCANNELKIHKTKQKISRNNEVFKLEWSIWLVSAILRSLVIDPTQFELHFHFLNKFTIFQAASLLHGTHWNWHQVLHSCLLLKQIPLQIFFLVLRSANTRKEFLRSDARWIRKGS